MLGKIFAVGGGPEAESDDDDESEEFLGRLLSQRQKEGAEEFEQRAEDEDEAEDEEAEEAREAIVDCRMLEQDEEGRELLRELESVQS